ncbi:aminotransferase class I/II-fold pyridoxal phosphate-dependent enzyme [Paenibacillus sp. LMG 31461]|uniref:Aminotransferase class I/II-fold pyridoxal phosphate-dependent enzyme n=1 Tax=Paenibacillus plantarum TaxID=2654975 RepID=A0ABX1XEZ5_9BACL|nr:DegT/DnrJ/EryC1/StrS family aminotransferase [Paenibacillus plantarum]NOU66514.1 aminotransferase class I/II-fold pyridoxal phosphate-dependent enzyme [Paenibacillus plantarum]
MEKLTLAVEGGVPVRKEGFPAWPIYGQLEEQLVLDVIRSGKWGGTGIVHSPEFTPKLPEMERRFADLHDATHAISVVNGTVAITVALQAAGVKPGDEVIVPPYTFIATAAAALAFGAIPVFVDIEEDTLLLDPDQVASAITSRTKAIIPVHLAGAPANMSRINEVAALHKLRVIEDAAQAVGASWEGRRVGAIGDLGTFSLQSSKNLNSGEGGIILTNNPELAEIAWSLCNVGRSRTGAWYQHDRIGQNYRMTELQAAIALAQMSRLEEQMLLRESNAKLLTALLGHIDGITVVKTDPRVTRHVNHLYMFKLDSAVTARIDKNDFIRKVNAEGIPISYGYVPLHRNEAIVNATRALTGEDRSSKCPVSERLSDKEVLWLSQNVLLADEQAMHDIAAAIRKVIESY